MSDIALSYSRLSTFEQCQAKFDYLYVSKTVKDKGNEVSAYGSRVHEVLELYGRGELDLATLGLEGKQTLQKWGGIVEMLNKKRGVKYYEYQMAIDKRRAPTGWYDNDVYFRSIADVLVVDGDTAYCLDYKTGKVKDNPTQLQLFAAMVFAHFPKVIKVKTSFIWLKFNKVDNTVYKRDHLESLWNGLQPRLDMVKEVVDIGFFKTKPYVLGALHKTFALMLTYGVVEDEE